MSPTIISSTPVITVDEFGTAILTCTATARPAPNITWTKWKTSLAFSDEITVLQGSAQLDTVTGLTIITSQLVISNTTFGDRGHYMCSASMPKKIRPSSATALIELVVNGKFWSEAKAFCQKKYLVRRFLLFLCQECCVIFDLLDLFLGWTGSNFQEWFMAP